MAAMIRLGRPLKCVWQGGLLCGCEGVTGGDTVLFKVVGACADTGGSGDT